ncbi:MAG: hypothetical protein M1839_005520 [Geoglossum umbratile]|nr:MAG: hypothetical protein M1839_005520 [Geoglossum umbratile]
MRFATAFVIITIGWYSMVTGQALVLYSRLHIVVRDSRKIRWVLYMIATNATLFHFSTTIFFAMTHNNLKLLPKYQIWERIQVTIFALQEIIISSLYIFETRKVLNPTRVFQEERIRRAMTHLIYMSIFVIFLDISILCVQYANLFQIQVVYKGAVYSIKLFVEFSILNELKSIFTNGPGKENGYQLSRQLSEAARGAAGGSGPPPNPQQTAGFDDRGSPVVKATVEHEGGTPISENAPRDRVLTHGNQGRQDSPSSSELNFAMRGY